MMVVGMQETPRQNLIDAAYEAQQHAFSVERAAVAYVAARDAVEAADGPALMDTVWKLDEAWHALRVAVGAPCSSEDCGCERPVEVLTVETPKPPEHTCRVLEDITECEACNP